MEHKLKRAAYRERTAQLAHGKMLAERSTGAASHLGYQGRSTAGDTYIASHDTPHGPITQTWGAPVVIRSGSSQRKPREVQQLQNWIDTERPAALRPGQRFDVRHAWRNFGK